MRAADALLVAEIFLYFQESHFKLTPALATDLASNIKATGAAGGKKLFEDYFAAAVLAGNLGNLYDAAPAVPATYLEIAGHGGPASCCPKEWDSPYQAVAARVLFENEARADTYLFDEKRSGFISMDSEGVWDDKVTPRAEFELYWKRRAAELKQPAPDKFFSAIRRFRRVGYFPGQSEVYLARCEIFYFNKYRKSLLKPVKGDWSPYDDLTLHLVSGDRLAQQHLLDWCAAQIQSLIRLGIPLKMGTMITFFGIPGAGKQLFCDAIAFMYGESNVVRLDQDQLDSKFSGQMENCLFVILNETMSDTNRSRATANKLKMMATDRRIASERKGVEAGSIDNYFNLVNCTNDSRPLVLEKGDRRHVVHYQKVPLNKDLGKLIADDQNGPQVHLAAFFEHLQNRVTNIKVGEIFETNARTKLMSDCEVSDVKFWREVVDLGFPSVALPYVSSLHSLAAKPEVGLKVGDEWFFTATIIRETYAHWAKLNGLKPTGGNKLWEALQEVIPEAQSHRARFGGVRCSAWSGIPCPPIGPELTVVQGGKSDALLPATKDLAPNELPADSQIAKPKAK